MKRWLIFLAVVFVLSVLSQFEIILFFAIVAFIVPGLILLASNTVLVYGAAGTIAHFVSRPLGLNSLILFGVAIAIVAVVPPLIGRHELQAFVAEQSASDFSRPTTIKPRSFALPLQWGRWQRPANVVHPNLPEPSKARPYCGDLCQRLLYAGAADAVYVTIAEDNMRDERGWIVYPKKVWRFRVERRDPCPEIMSDLLPQFQLRATAGECLIEERVDAQDADVIFEEDDHRKLMDDLRQRGDWGRFSLWKLRRAPKTIAVKERAIDGWKVMERKTEISALVPPLPFYVGAHEQSIEIWPQVATWTRETQSAEPLEILARRYGVHIPPPAPR